MRQIKLVALDLDGTLFNHKSQITPKTVTAIQKALHAGVHVVISTGRPAVGIPMEEIQKTDIRYAITTNGSGIYQLNPRECIYENSMDKEIVLPIIDFLMTKDIHMDAFIHGGAYSPTKCREVAYKLDMPEALRHYIVDTRIRKDDLAGFIREENLTVQKMTLNFYPLLDGTLKDREEVKAFLLANPNIQCVSGGYNNLEFTKAGVTKGLGLFALAKHLGISMEETMAIGDTENDISILEAAGLGVAMENATEEVKAVADIVTGSNENDGVAEAINQYVLVS